MKGNKKGVLYCLFILGILTLGFIGARLTQLKPSKFPYRRVNITHAWIFRVALDECESHQGLHYIVNDTTVYAEATDQYYKDDLPCAETHYFRCQDGTRIEYVDPATHCFISESQIDDTLTNKDVTNEYK